MPTRTGGPTPRAGLPANFLVANPDLLGGAEVTGNERVQSSVVRAAGLGEHNPHNYRLTGLSGETTLSRSCLV